MVYSTIAVASLSTIAQRTGAVAGTTFEPADLREGNQAFAKTLQFVTDIELALAGRQLLSPETGLPAASTSASSGSCSEMASSFFSPSVR